MAPSTTCRSCRAPGLRPFLDLGETPLADALVDPGRRQPEARYPLEVAFCEQCSLVQILEEVPPETLFVDNYLYFSSVSDHLLRHSAEHVDSILERRALGPGSLVVEVASNDGYLLRWFRDRGVPVLGIDPAPDQAAAARAAGIPTLTEFFGPALAAGLRARGTRADVIIANNVMAHVPDLNGFVAGLRTLVADDGEIHVENPYVGELIRHREFDTIYHEHFCYFSCTAVDRLVRRHGLFLNDVAFFPDLHGGTLRWHLAPTERVSERVEEYLYQEERSGMTRFDFYADFADDVARIRSGLLDLLEGLRAGGARIGGYGAAAKGSTLLNYCGIGPDLVEFVADRNVHKQGRLMPGVGIPIVDPAALLDRSPDYVLLLPWNFKDEILHQQQEYLRRGGRFIVPVPKPVIL
jgi:SAM-dependent methyltransferase